MKKWGNVDVKPHCKAIERVAELGIFLRTKPDPFPLVRIWLPLQRSGPSG